MTDNKKYKNHLFISPHTDDSELGCGGTISRLLREGENVFIAVFSIARSSVPDGYEEDALLKEFFDAASALGVPKENLFDFDFPVRNLSSYRQDILEELIKIKDLISPDVIYTPSINDVHQDHSVMCNECIRAYKDRSLLGYELPWNNTTFTTSSFVVLTEEDINNKWNALKCYKTQFDLKRKYFSYDFIKSHASFRGLQIKHNYAEAYETIRYLI